MLTRVPRPPSIGPRRCFRARSRRDRLRHGEGGGGTGKVEEQPHALRNYLTIRHPDGALMLLNCYLSFPSAKVARDCLIFRVASFAWRNPAECKSKVTTSRLCPAAKSFLPGVASAASRRGNRRSNFCSSLAALGPLCGCVTIICLRQALTRTIGNGRSAACRSSRLSLKGAIRAGFAS